MNLAIRNIWGSVNPLVIVGALLVCGGFSPMLRGQLAGITSEGHEVLLVGALRSKPPKLGHGSFTFSGVNILGKLTEDGALSLEGSGVVTGLLERGLRSGEHLRYELNARVLECSGFFIGFEGDQVNFKVRFHSNGTVEYLDQEEWRIIAELKHVIGEWQYCGIDYVVGSDQALLTVGRVQVPVAVQIGTSGDPQRITRVYAACDALSRGDVRGVKAYAVLEERVRTLPVFGQIKWRRIAMPFVVEGPGGGISGHSMSADATGRLYVSGGFIPAGDGSGDTDHRTSKWSYRYDPKTEVWSRLIDMPGRREYVTGAAAEKMIFVMGGGKQRATSEGKYQPFGSVFSMDVSGQAPSNWAELPSLNVPRTHLASGAWNNQLIVAGGNEYDHTVVGYHPSTIRATTEVLDLTRVGQGWRVVAPIPGAGRGWSASVIANGRFFLFGGLTFTPGEEKGSRMRKIRLNETLAYDFAANTWKALRASPYPACGWKAALYENRYAMLVGGTYESEHRSAYRWNAQVLVYDTMSDVWYRLLDSALPPGAVYNDSGVVVVGDTIYVSGGEAIAGAHYNTLLIGSITRRAVEADRIESDALGESAQTVGRKSERLESISYYRPDETHERFGERKR